MAAPRLVDHDVVLDAWARGFDMTECGVIGQANPRTVLSIVKRARWREDSRAVRRRHKHLPLRYGARPR